MIEASSKTTATGILLFAHGSRVEEANEGVRELAGQVQTSGPYAYVRATFLELAEPDLGTAIAQAVEAGMRSIVVVPYFLTMGIHLRRDLPSLLAPQKERFPGIEILVGQSLESHPHMPSIILGRVQEALDGTKTSDRHD